MVYGYERAFVDGNKGSWTGVKNDLREHRLEVEHMLSNDMAVYGHEILIKEWEW